MITYVLQYAAHRWGKTHSSGEEGPLDNRAFSVEKTLLGGRRPLDNQAFRAPNQGLESSFCCRIAWPGLEEKDNYLLQAPVACPPDLSPCAQKALRTRRAARRTTS